MARELSILVPVYNEEENILPLADQVASALRLDSRSYELVFVDDASIDASWSRIQTAHAKDPRVRGLKHMRNAGQSAALWTGIQATASPLIATLDGDLQNDPADLPKLLAALDGCDLVCGVRAKRQDNFVRRASSRVARQARRLVLGVDFCDIGCGLRVFRRAVLEGVFPFNGLHRFLPVLVHNAGGKTREVDVNHRPRVAGVSKYGVWNRMGRGIADLLAIAWYRKRYFGRVAVETLGFGQEP